MDKSKAGSGVVEKKKKQPWPLWKKLVVGGIALLIIIALAVGLGVGLTRGKGGGEDEDEDEGGEGGDEGGDTGNKPNRTSIWQPKVESSWQIVLKEPIDLDNEDDINPDVDIYDLDLFDNEDSTFATLQKAGKKVICYFSAGSWEDWRDDENDFKDADKGKVMDGWESEKWLNISSPNVRSIMKKRIALASGKGCDAIDPDNIDGFQNDNGLDLTADDSVNYVKFLSDEAAKYNMSTGLKNAGSIIDDVLDYVAFSVNEQCIEYEECETFAAFIDADKPVFNIEYPEGAPNKIKASMTTEICSEKGKAKGSEGFSTVIKKMDLDGWVEYCDGKTYTTKVGDNN